MSASLILQIPSTPSSVTLRTQPANITVQKESAETVLVGVAGPAGPTGPGGALGYYGAFSSYVAQTATSVTEAYPFRFEQTDESNGVSITQGTAGFPSRITFGAVGTYNIQFSAQFQNTDNQAHDVQIWLRKNEVDVVGSTGLVAVPAKHAGADGHTIAGWNFVFTVAANDYYEFLWQTDNLGVSIVTYPGGTTPTTPSTASIVLTVTQVMNTQVGPTGPTGPTGVIAATDPIVYTAGTQTVSANTTSLRTLSRQAGTNPLRSWQQAYSDARYGLLYGLGSATTRTADVLVIGDSITEGYGSSSTAAGQPTYVRRFAQLLAETANTDGRTGVYIPCSVFNGFIPDPKWTAAGTTLEASNGLGLRRQQISAGGSMTITVTGTSAVVYYQRQRVFPLNQGAIRIRAYQGTGTGGALLFDRTEDTFDNSLPSGAQQMVAQTIPVSAWGSRGTVTIKVEQVTASDGKTGTITCDGVFVHDGTETQGVRVWCSGKSGSKFSTWNDPVNAALDTDWLSIMRGGLTYADATSSVQATEANLIPSLVVIALGTNEIATTAADIKTAMATIVDNINDTTGGTVGLPSFAFLIPPANLDKTDAYWAPIVTAMYEKAEELGCAIWDWSSLFGSYSSVTGDPFGWSADNTHPTNPGHIALGDFATQQALAGVSAVTGTEGLINSISATAPATFDVNTRTIAVTTGTGLTTSSGALVPDFGTTSGKVTQGNDSRLDAATKLVTNATTTQIVSTTAKTAFLTQSIGPVTAGDVYLLTAFGDFLQQSGGAATYTIEFALGTTTLGTSNLLSFASAGTRRKWHLELQLICGTTSAQTIGGLFTTGGLSGAVTLPLVAPSASAPLTYTATEDMSSAKNLVWSVTMSANSASMDWRTLGYTLRRLR